MKWGWVRRSEDRLEYKEGWAVFRHSGRWYVVQNGMTRLQDYSTPEEAINAAEEIIDRKQ
jgi:hypothetical protein